MMFRISRRNGLIAAAPLALALTVMQSYPAQAAPCAYNGYHYYSYAYSNAGPNQGTGAQVDTWTKWSLDGHASSDSPFSNETVWTVNDPSSGENFSQSLEVGIATGRLNQGSYSNGMYPYYTENNGNCPCQYFTSTSLPTGKVIWNSATDNGAYGWAYVNNKLLAEIFYGISTPRLNYEQAEVNYHDIWMGGGSGSASALEYQNTSNQWNDWGVIHGGTDAYNSATNSTITPAGYGYFNETDSPNGVVEGGYGQSC